MFSKPLTVNTDEFQPPRNTRQRPEWGRQAGSLPLESRSNAGNPNLNMWNMYGSAHGMQPQSAVPSYYYPTMPSAHEQMLPAGYDTHSNGSCVHQAQLPTQGSAHGMQPQSAVPSYYYPTMPSAHEQMLPAGYDTHYNGSCVHQAQLPTQDFAYPSVVHDPANTCPNAVPQPEATTQDPNIEHPEFVLVRVGLSDICFEMPQHQGYCDRCGKNNPKDTPALKYILRAALTATFMDQVERIFQFISPDQRAYYYELILYFLSTRKYLSDTKFFLYMYQDSDAEDLLLGLLKKWVWHNEYMADKCRCFDYFVTSLFETAWAPRFPGPVQPMYLLAPYCQNIIPTASSSRMPNFTANRHREQGDAIHREN